MSIPMLPDLEPDYERTIDELDEAANDALYGGRGRAWNALRLEWMERRRQRDFALDLNDQLNDAGLVIVSEDEWKAWQITKRIMARGLGHYSWSV